MESIGCFFLYPAFWLALFPGFWLVDGDWILSSHWCKRTLPSTGPRSDHLVTLLHLLRKCRKILPEVTSPEVTWPDITSQKWSRGHAQPFPVFFSYYSSSTKYTLGTHPSKGTPFGVTWLSVTSGSPVGHAQWYILKKETRVPVAHAHTVTFVASFPVTSLPVTSFPVSWLPVTSLPAIFSYTFEVSGAKWPGGQI